MKYVFYHFIFTFQFLGILCLFSNCSSQAISQNTESLAKKLVHADNFGGQLSVFLESSLEFKQNKAISAFLSHLGQSIVDSDSVLKGSFVRVKIIQNTLGKWKSYALPGTRLYVPLELLKKCTYEKEVAALLSVNLGRLIDFKKWADFEESFLKNHQAFYLFFNKSEFSEGGENEEKKAIQAAVSILYEAGYDPRSLISLLDLYFNHLDRSPYQSETLNVLKDFIWSEVSVYAPLRNPIMNSENFIDIKKRIQQL